MIDDVAEKIEKEVYLQSKLIQSNRHAYDLLETAEIIRSERVEKECFDYIAPNLKSLKYLKRAFAGRKFSLEYRMRLKGL